MTAQDDDADGDRDGLMRSVWRDMREEEPPARGFAELMAAARAQAEPRPPEPGAAWWRRAFAMLVRPPMLAAATVVSLAGGAVVLRQRGVEGATPSAAEASDRAQPQEVPGQQGALVPPGKLVVAAAVAAPSRGVPVTPSIVGGAVTLEHPARPSSLRRPSPAVAGALGNADRATGTAGGQGSKSAGASGTDEDQAPAAEPMAKTVKGPEVEAPEVMGRTLTGRAADPELTYGVLAADSRPPAPAARPPRPSTEPLIKQLNAAVKRNDCAAVEATAALIRQLDITTYMAHVVTRPAIASCLK